MKNMAKRWDSRRQRKYLAAANAVILNEEALHKTQKDGDDVYYLEETNDFVVVSPQGICGRISTGRWDKILSAAVGCRFFS